MESKENSLSKSGGIFRKKGESMGDRARRLTEQKKHLIIIS